MSRMKILSAVDAIYILWLRQLKRYFRDRIRVLSSLGQPVLFLVSLGFGFGPLYRRAGAGNYLQYLVPGVIAMGILFPGVFSGIEIIWDRQFGFLKETLVAPVSRFQIVLGKTLVGATTALIQGVIVLMICSVAGFRIENFLLLPVALGVGSSRLGAAHASRINFYFYSYRSWRRHR